MQTIMIADGRHGDALDKCVHCDNEIDPNDATDPMVLVPDTCDDGEEWVTCYAHLSCHARKLGWTR